MRSFMTMVVLTFMAVSANAQGVLTLGELDELANNNKKAISINGENISSLADRIADLEARPVCDCGQGSVGVGVGVGVKTDYRMPVKIKVPTITDSRAPEFFSPPSTTSSRIISVGQPVVTSVGQPSYGLNWVSSSVSGTCTNPNCTSPNCPSRVNNSVYSQPTSYTTVRRSGNGRVRCSNGRCWRE